MDKYGLERNDKLYFNIFIIDILFLPLFPVFSVSLSLPLLIFWYVKNKKSVGFLPELKFFPLIIVLMALSTFICNIYPIETRYSTTFATSLKRFFQYLTCFWYYIFFRYYFSHYKVDVSKYIFWIILYIGIFAFFFFFNQSSYAYFKISLAPFDNHTKRFLSNEVFYRFNYLWADPNNVAYAVGSLLLFYLMESSNSLLKKNIVIIISIFILLCTMSMGGMLSSMVAFILLFILSIRNFKLTQRLLNQIFLSGLLLIVLIYFIYPYIIDFIDSGIIESILQRKHSYNEDDSGGRLGDFMQSIKYLNPLFLFLGSGKEGFVTEIGHMYLLFLYGLPCYIFFMYIFFWRKFSTPWTYMIPLIPMFAGFTMNIAIIEQKFLLILLLISSYLTSYYGIHKNNKNYKEKFTC